MVLFKSWSLPGDALGSLSKSRLLAFRQCPKRLWLEVHKSELRAASLPAQSRLKAGLEVGAVARRLYDTAGTGTLVSIESDGIATAIRRTRELLATRQPIFEAGVTADDVVAFADLMLPARQKQQDAWRIVEVKSSGGVKDHHRDDAAIQAFVAKQANIPLKAIAVAHIDTAWVYPGGDRYDGLLVEEDLTDETAGRAKDVENWIAGARSVVARKREPQRSTGAHCTSPTECGFLDYCKGKEPQPDVSVEVLPRISKKLRAHIAEKKIIELKHVPDALLNDLQRRVKRHTLRGRRYFDAKGAAKELAQYPLPALFLDFESISFAVPIWKGTRPYQQLPFQFSLHTLTAKGVLGHADFLDLSGRDPSRRLATALVDACTARGPIFVYNAAFEKARVAELAERFPTLRKKLAALANRIVDLLPIAQRFYYHPAQAGSWSIKALLPSLIPELDYKVLDGVRDGGMAMEAYLEAIHPRTGIETKLRLEQELLSYCKLDTYAMVRIWQIFAGRRDVAV